MSVQFVNVHKEARKTMKPHEDVVTLVHRIVARSEPLVGPLVDYTSHFSIPENEQKPCLSKRKCT